MTSGIDRELLDSIERFFSDTFDHATVAEAEGRPLPTSLWDKVTALDLHLVGVPEEAGGAGGGLSQIAAVARAVGRHSAPVPLVEHHLASWAIARAGDRGPDGLSVLVPGSPEDTLALRDGAVRGSAEGVPWASSSQNIVAILDDEHGRPHVIILDHGGLEFTRGFDLAGQPRDTIRADASSFLISPAACRPEEVARRGRLLRAAQIAGALETLAVQTVQYVQQREQFGRPIGAFQAVQHHVVTVEQMATMTALAVSRAVTACEAGSGGFECDAAFLVASQNAATAVRAAHQAHGAIGMTRESGLHLLTRRLNTWRWDFCDVNLLAAGLGNAVIGQGRLSSVISAAPGSIEVPA